MELNHRLGQINKVLRTRHSLFYSESNEEPEAFDQEHIIRSLAEKYSFKAYYVTRGQLEGYWNTNLKLKLEKKNLEYSMIWFLDWITGSWIFTVLLCLIYTNTWNLYCVYHVLFCVFKIIYIVLFNFSLKLFGTHFRIDITGKINKY